MKTALGANLPTFDFKKKYTKFITKNLWPGDTEGHSEAAKKGWDKRGRGKWPQWKRNKRGPHHYLWLRKSKSPAGPYDYWIETQAGKYYNNKPLGKTKWVVTWGKATGFTPASQRLKRTRYFDTEKEALNFAENLKFEHDLGIANEEDE
jgi:hypothetical protein